MSDAYRAVIIDDEAWIREGLIEHIDWERIGIQLAGSFEDGADAIKELAVHPVDIIMTDIRMPNMTGIQFLSELRRIEQERPDHSSSKVIIMSGFDDFKYAQEAIRLGASDYLLKPTDVEEIEDVLLKVKSVCEGERQSDRERGQPHSEALPEDDGLPEELDEAASHLVKLTVKIVNEQYTQDLHLAEIAEELLVTPNYLSRIFRLETGISFSSYLSQKRVKRACELLKGTLLKIYQIGEAVGYPNPRYFSEWFQKMTGMSPGDYRKFHS